MLNISIIKYILLISLRNKLYIGIILSLVACFFLGIFLGSTNIIEQSQTAIAFIAGSSRVVVIFGMAIFVCINVAKLFDNKEIDFIISKAISRQKFILSFLAGYLICALLIVFPLILVMNILSNLNGFGALLWSLSLIFEVLIAVCFAFLCSLILENSLLAIMASIAFYLMSRMMGFFVMALKTPWEETTKHQTIYEYVLKIFSIVFPRLDLFTQSKWLIYGVENMLTVKIILLQSLIYIPLLIFMAFYDVKRKEF